MPKPTRPDQLHPTIEAGLTEAGRVLAARDWLDVSATARDHTAFIACIAMAAEHLRLVVVAGEAAIAAATASVSSGTAARATARPR
jgi:hypothetical protein